MSIAKLEYVKKSRKVWTCSKCREEIPIGSKVIGFAVGFRGYDQKRCGDKPECFPTYSERESSMVAEIYGAQESMDLGACESLDDLENAVQDVIDACESVCDEYESGEMYDINEMLQERVDILRSAGEELQGWADALDDEPEWEGFREENPDGTEEEFQVAHEEWLDAAREAANEAINNMEMP